MIGFAALRGRPLLATGMAGLVLFAGAVALGWRAGEAPHLQAGQAPATQWVLPQLRTTDTEQDTAYLMTRRPWGGSTAFRDPEAMPPTVSWQLAGVVGRDGRWFALVAVGPQPTAALQYRTIGERLPDDTVLVQIDTDSVTSEGPQGVRRVHRLFEKRP